VVTLRAIIAWSESFGNYISESSVSYINDVACSLQKAYLDGAEHVQEVHGLPKASTDHDLPKDSHKALPGNCLHQRRVLKRDCESFQHTTQPTYGILSFRIGLTWIVKTAAGA